MIASWSRSYFMRRECSVCRQGDLLRIDHGAHTTSKVSLIPDFISNCGMARVFAYFMETESFDDRRGDFLRYIGIL
jgi:hypothetical protein